MVGDCKSANTKHLTEICKMSCPRVFPVSYTHLSSAAPVPEEPKEIRVKKKTEGKLVKPGLSDLKDAWTVLWPPIRRALARTRQGIRIDPLDLSVTVGGAEDPAEAARTCGMLEMLVWTLSLIHIVTKADLFALGLTGGTGSAARRQALLRQLDLPEHLTPNALLEALNLLYTREAFLKSAESLFSTESE